MRLPGKSRQILVESILLALIAISAPRAIQVMAQDSASTKTAATPAGNAEIGKLIYKKMGCPDCHGYVGQGATRTGPRIGPNPVPFPEFVKAHRKPSGQMPPYSSQIISDRELIDVYAFLSSLPEPQNPNTIPLLNSK
jgi:hypothetical protein